MAEFKDLDKFEVKIKAQLNKDDDEQFTADLGELKKFLNKFGGIDNRGVRSLITEFYEMITAEERIETKNELFSDLVDELRAYLARKAKIRVTQSDFDSRKKRIRQVSKELQRLGSQIVSLQSKELSMDDLGKEQNNAVIIVEELQSKVLKLLEEKANLENKNVYYDNDLDFGDLTDNAQLNEILGEEILTNFKENKDLPLFEDVDSIVQNFSLENHVSLNSKNIFEKICSKLKFHRQKSVEYSLNSYMNDKNLSKGESMPAEDEALKQKLDLQNNFWTQLDEIVKEFMNKKRSTDEQSDNDGEPTANRTGDDDIISISSDEDDLPVTRPTIGGKVSELNKLEKTEIDLIDRLPATQKNRFSASLTTIFQTEEDNDVLVTFGYEEVEILSDEEKDQIPADLQENNSNRNESERTVATGLQESELSRPEMNSVTNEVEVQNRSIASEISENVPIASYEMPKESNEPENCLTDANNNEDSVQKRKIDKDDGDTSTKKSKIENEEEDCILID